MRQTAAEIDHAILDVAAGIFATYGFAHASVQQIADAVGYSKPGLLHRFGSKEALHRAALVEAADTAEALVDHALVHRSGPDQVHRLLELMTRKALERPGIVQLMLRATEADAGEPGVEAIRGIGQRLVEILHRSSPSPSDQLRVVLALHLVVTAATTQHSKVDPDAHVDREELVPMVVALAAHVVGADHRVPA